MSNVCYECGRPKIDGHQIEREVQSDRYSSWWRVSELKVGDKFLNGRFEVVGKETHAEASQGETFDLWIAFKEVATNKFFKKLGRGDSYGEVEWDGAVFEVQAVAKTVTVWEIAD